MTRAALFVVLLLTLLAPDLDAQGRAFKCLLNNKCSPPPCEFMAELNIAKAFRRAASRRPAANLSSQNQKAIDQWHSQEWKEQAEAQRKYSKCRLYTPAPNFFADRRDCSIKNVTQSFEDRHEATKEEALATAGTCSELVEAEYAAGEARQVACVAFKGAPETLGGTRQRELLAAHARVASLQKSLLGFLSSCTPNAATAQKIADAGLSSLLKEGAKARNTWKKAQRAGK